MSANIAYEPKIFIQFYDIAPDEYTRLSDSKYPPDDFVVSRTYDGKVASIYKQNTWDWSAYDHLNNSCKFIFDSWLPKDNPPTDYELSIINKIKWIMFSIIWFRREPLGAVSLQQRLTILRDIAKYCVDNKLSFEDFFNNAQTLKRYIERKTHTRISLLPPLIKDLLYIGNKNLGFDVLGGKTLKQLSNLKSEYLSNCKQHPPIPSRIYLLLIERINKELDEFAAVADQLLRLTIACADHPLNGLSISSQKRKAYQLGIKWSKNLPYPTFDNLVNKFKLIDFFSSQKENIKYSINTTYNLKGVLSRYIRICMQAIHLYSGMRSSEVANLPFHCHDSFRSKGKDHHLIIGRTTKLNHGNPKPTKWVTSVEGYKAIKLMQKISLTIYKVIGDVPKKNNPTKYPLFVSLSYLGLETKPLQQKSNKYDTGKYSDNLQKYLPYLIPSIDEADIKELEEIDLHRPWRSEDRFQVGKPWPLTSHQFRRSLALYASKSGYVSLPSLRRCLQHITNEMASYYSKGSVFAKDLIKNDSNHFAKEYQDTQPESQALAYIAQVLFSDERLFGPHGEWVERHVRVKVPFLSETNRQETIKRFQKGEISYKETHLGGCTELKPCDKQAMRSIIGCLDCNRSVIKISKLDRLIKAQQTLVETLKPNTMEWHTENSDLTALLTYKARISKRKVN